MIPFLIPLAISAATAGYGAIKSRGREKRLQSQLDELNRTPYQDYKVDPTVTQGYNQAMGDASNPRGYSGATRSDFMNDLNRNFRGRLRAGINAGGSPRAVNAVLAAQNSDALGSFYAGDEQMKRSNRLAGLNRSASYANIFQNIRDRNTSFSNDYKLRTEMALGEGIRSQRDYRQNLITGLGRDLVGYSALSPQWNSTNSLYAEEAIGDFGGNMSASVPSIRSGMGVSPYRFKRGRI